MAVVTISVYGRDYQLACDAGQEDSLRGLGFEVDERLRELARRMSGANEHMLLLLAAITLADELRDMKQYVVHLREALDQGGGQAGDGQQARLIEMEAAMAHTLEEVASRIERIAEQIEMR